MKAILFRSLAIAALMSFALSAASQTPERQTPQNASVQSPHRRPYVAHFKITRTSVMPDGSTGTTVSIETVAGDGRGRIYTGTENLAPSKEQGEQALEQKIEPNKGSTYSVEDPTASTLLTWNSKSRRATLYQYPEELHGNLKGCWANSKGIVAGWGPEEEDWHPIPTSSSPVSKSRVWTRDTTGARRQILETSESLGTKTIGGFLTRGLRISTEPLPGEPPDHLFVGTIEFWKSYEPDLKLSEKSTGLRNGNQTAYTKTKELIDLKLSEPDPTLFFPSKDYIVDRIELHQIVCDKD